MNEIENQNKTSSQINKMKKLLYEISTKNENLNKENLELNEKIISLVKLLKIKDKIINQISEKQKKVLLKKIILSKEKKRENILRKYLNKMKIKKKIISNKKNLYKTTPINLTIDKNSKKKKSDIGVGNLGINLKFYIRRENCLTILSKWQFIKRAKENKEEMIKNLKISKSGFFDIDNEKIPSKEIQYKVSKNNIDILRKKKNSAFYINKVNTLFIKGNESYSHLIIKKDKSNKSFKSLNKDYVITNMNMKIKITKNVANIGINTDNHSDDLSNNYINEDKENYDNNYINNYNINNNYINLENESQKLSNHNNLKNKDKENIIIKEVPVKEFINLIQEENNMLEIIGMKRLNNEKNESIKKRKKVIQFKIENNTFNLINENKKNDERLNNNNYTIGKPKNQNNKIEDFNIINNNDLYEDLNSTIPKRKSYEKKKMKINQNECILEKKFDILEIENNPCYYILKNKPIQKLSVKKEQILIKGKIKNNKLSIKKEQLSIKGKIKNNKLSIKKEQLSIKGKIKNNQLFIKKEQLSIKGKEKKDNQIKLFFDKHINININAIKKEKKILKLNKQNFSLLSQKISKKKIPFSINKQQIELLSKIKKEKEKNTKKQFSINKQQIELLSKIKNEKEKNIIILEMETVETFDILNDNYDKLNNEFNIENPSENFFKNNNEKINEFLDLEISKSYLFILSDVDREEKQKLINQQIIQLYNYKFELFCKLLLLYQKKVKHFFFLNLLINSSKIKINFIINMCKNLLLSNKLHNLIRKKSKNNLYKRFKQFQINCLKNEILFKDTIIYELDNNNTILQGKIQKFQLIFEEYEKSKNNKQEQTINKYESKIEQLNNLLKEKNIQYEKLKKISSESTQELIETNNENSEQKKEIKQLTIEKNNLLKKLDEYNYTLNSLKENISLREEEILKIKNENENNQNNLNLKNEELKIENINYKNKIDEMNNYLIQLNSEMKKVKFENNELKKSKEEFSEILKQTKNNEIENINLKNLLEQYKINYEEITEKYNDIKKKHDELNNIVEEREKQLLQAMGEMEGYSVLLEQIEERIRKAEEERDKAINDVKTIRQRYINLLGEDK